MDHVLSTPWAWVLFASAVAVLGFLVLRARSVRNEEAHLEACKVGLEEIGTRLKRGELSEADAESARLARVARKRNSILGFAQNVQRTPQMLVVAAAGILPLAGIGAAVSYLGGEPGVAGTTETTSFSGPNGEVFASLDDYARSVGADHPTDPAGSGDVLPDVNTMIDRLAARLKTTPQDLEGWRTLGWSYFHTGRYEQAVAAFETALKLDPGSAELKLSYEQAKSKASGGDAPSMEAPSVETGTAEAAGDPLQSENAAAIAAMSEQDRNAAIRSMVDGLAERLKSAPRDEEGWIRLMRSRLVLGEKDVAGSTYRKALEIFGDDQAASARITAAAAELGLNSN